MIESDYMGIPTLDTLRLNTLDCLVRHFALQIGIAAEAEGHVKGFASLELETDITLPNCDLPQERASCS